MGLTGQLTFDEYLEIINRPEPKYEIGQMVYSVRVHKVFHSPVSERWYTASGWRYAVEDGRYFSGCINEDEIFLELEEAERLAEKLTSELYIVKAEDMVIESVTCWESHNAHEWLKNHIAVIKGLGVYDLRSGCYPFLIACNNKETVRREVDRARNAIIHYSACGEKMRKADPSDFQLEDLYLCQRKDSWARHRYGETGDLWSSFRYVEWNGARKKFKEATHAI